MPFLGADVPVIVWNGGVGTEYVVRGINQTNRTGQIFAGADLTDPSLYAGVWTSNVDFRPDDRTTFAEIDVYGGYRRTIARVNFDVGGIEYAYAGEPRHAKLSFFETYLKASRSLGSVTLTGSAFYSSDYFGGQGRSWYDEAAVAYTVSPRWQIAGAVGHQFIQAGGGYFTWNVGPTVQLTSHLSLDARYWGTDQGKRGSIYRPGLVLQLKGTF